MQNYPRHAHHRPPVPLAAAAAAATTTTTTTTLFQEQLLRGEERGRAAVRMPPEEHLSLTYGRREPSGRPASAPASPPGVRALAEAASSDARRSSCCRCDKRLGEGRGLSPPSSPARKVVREAVPSVCSTAATSARGTMAFEIGCHVHVAPVTVTIEKQGKPRVLIGGAFFRPGGRAERASS